MHNGKKISVAIASYNGENFIREQIESICSQTIVPDEIVVSDDGSQDSTVQIVQELANKYAEKIDIKVLFKSIRHGVSGNFECAITHSTGDYIFVSDQDDIWYPNKIEVVMKVFEYHKEAECVFHEANLIDEKGKEIPGIFNHWTHTHLSDVHEIEGFRLDRETYLEPAISQPIAPGMCICITKESLATSLPFPKCDLFHDQWMEFCAVLNNKCFYIPVVVEGYRLHGNNTAGNSAYRGRGLARLMRVLHRLEIDNVKNALILSALGSAMLDLMENREYENSSAYRTALRLKEIGSNELTAVTSGRLQGAKRLYKMYRTDSRYRSIGKSYFLSQLFRILFYSRNHRKSVIHKSFSSK